MADRSEVLGFKPQKETPYNKLLPYADQLDEESKAQLAEIKAQLSRTVQLRDIKVGASHWAGQLQKYIRMHGQKFAKEDHLLFINLSWELIMIPDLEYSQVQKFSHLLVALLKKRELLTPEELSLPWRPLYKLIEGVVYSPYEHHGLVLFPGNIENVLKSVVRVVRPYFPPEATQEMLDEWHPLLCPFDMTMVRGMYFLQLFLPTLLAPEHHDKGFKLWFEEFIGLWDSCQNSPQWEGNLVNLFARLASDTVGHIDWDPHIPKIFTRILRSVNLPVGSTQLQVGRNGNCYDIGNSVWWIVSMMGGGSSCLEHMEKLFKSLESFYHPSNHGKWNSKLMKLLFKLPQTVVKRLHRERWRESWEPKPPKSHCLSDENVTAFVNIMIPIVSVAMFSKTGSHDSAGAFQQLAVLRPELVIPPLLEKTYPALETLTEPHRLIACLHCTVSVVRPMLGSPRWYPGGRLHVVPLLNLCLPGIDTNDIKKCLITFQLLSTIVSLVPLVDCSEAVNCRTDLTEEEREICFATAQFEDFVLQFMDRVFGLIENSSQIHTRTDSAATDKLTHEETMLEVGLLSTFNAIMQQSSDSIYKSALERLFRFVSGSVFEIRVAGRFTADLVRAAVKVNPEKTLKMFLSYFCANLKSRAASEDISKEEHLDDEFLWNMRILSEVVRCDGVALLPYKADLMAVLRVTLHLKCKEAADLAGTLLRHLLKALTLTYAVDYRSSQIDWDAPFSEQLPIREWAKPGNLQELKLKWHVSSAEEKDMTRELLSTFLLQELRSIDQHVQGMKTLDREELLQCLNIVLHCVIGAGCVLPVWQGERVKLVESMVELKRFNNTVGLPELNLDGENVRELITKTIRPLLDHILATSEDDTKSLNQLIKVYSALLFVHGLQKEDFDGRWKSLHIVKKTMENKLLGKKKHIRALLVDRAQLQHELRVINQSAKVFTELHKDMFYDLLRLSISRYSQVRRTAQGVLGQGFHLFVYSYRTMLDTILSYLRNDSSIEHHQFKGALYVILGDNKRSLVTKRSWEVMVKVWPAVVKAQHSEKPSILRLVDDIIDQLHKNVESTEIHLKVHEELLSAASGFYSSKSFPRPACLAPSADELANGVKVEGERNATDLSAYENLVSNLVEQIEHGNLRWKFHQVALEMLSLLVRLHVRLPVPAVRVFVQNLVHDSLAVRKIGVYFVSAILKQQKRSHKKEPFDPYRLTGSQPPADGVIRSGDRPDNMWLHYHGENLLESKEKWDAVTMVDKTHWGYYCWPKNMLKYSPSEQQPPLDRSYEELSEEEKPIYDYFSNQDFVDKLIGFLTLEENKGKDKFHSRHFTLFKGLFRNFGDTFLPFFKPQIEKLVADTSHDKHDCSQRCAAELISGILRGSKHWHYEKVKSLWEWLLPVIKTGLSNMTVESVGDWGTCFATSSESRDPRKLGPMLELLLEEPLRGDGGSFGDTSRLYVLQGALAQQEWRVPGALHRLLDYLSGFLYHPYKNVRDRLGSVIVNLFLYDVALPNGHPTTSPKRGDFIRKVLPQLDILKESAEANGNGASSSTGSTSAGTPSSSSGTDSTTTSEPMDTSSEPTPMEITRDGDNKTDPDTIQLNILDKVVNHTNHNGTGLDDGESEERKNAIRLCKTVLKWLQGTFSRMFQCVCTDVFKFLPVIAVLQSETKDDELKRECVVTLACMAQALLTPDLVPVMLNTVKEVASLSSWHARGAILGYLQVTVFCNLFLLQAPELKQQVEDIVLDLLCDDQLEVRELAAVTLGGFFHCGYLIMNDKLMTHFEKMRRTKIKKKSADPLNAERLIKRHAGVLGMSACVLAFPYDVPQFMPKVLMDLSDHLDDPQLIQMTVKKTLSNFKRTHHDNWQDHKQMFTDDQLVVLTDLLVSPNYYA